MNRELGDDTEVAARIRLAEQLLATAAERIADAFHTRLQTTQKSPNDYVSELDTSIEQYVQNELKQAFPEDNFYGEESGASGGTNQYLWVYDPLDGTNNFLRGLPFAGTQIALLKDDVIVYSLIHRPFTSEKYYAQKGQGAFYENFRTNEQRQLQVSERSLSEAMAIFDSKVGKTDNASTPLFNSLIDKIASVRVLGVAVYDLPAVAEGAVEFLISGIAKKYDVAPGWLLIEEAGGTVYSLHGEPTIDNELLILSNQAVTQELLQSIQSRSEHEYQQ
ncbi:MAG: inositol monophosphatase [Candidatus Saccharimonadales bacterium]